MATWPWPLEPKVIVLPDLRYGAPLLPGDRDPGDVTFDEHGTPMLVWHDSYPIGRRHEPSWVLSYLEPDGNGVEDYPLGGILEDVDSVLKDARKHLEMIAREFEQGTE